MRQCKTIPFPDSRVSRVLTKFYFRNSKQNRKESVFSKFREILSKIIAKQKKTIISQKINYNRHLKQLLNSVETNFSGKNWISYFSLKMVLF